MSEIRSDFHTKSVTDFIENIQYQRSNPYYFIGRIDNWDTEPIAPAPPLNSTGADVDIRDNIMYMRRIESNEISMVTKRYNWESGQVFDQWDHTLEMEDKPFYCVNSDYNVYKCLNNNNGAPSTVEPNSVSLFSFTTSDGYVWKYMYNIPIFKRRKFMNFQYMPVQKALSDAFYNRGAVEQVVITSAGSGYTTSPQVVLLVDGDGSGAILSAVVSPIDGSIVDVIIRDGGSGYTNASISVVSATGTGIYDNTDAVLNAVIYNGSIVNVTIEDPGVDYQPDLATVIIVQGDGTGASFTPVVADTGEIVDVIIVEPGIGYSYMNLTVIGTGTGALLEPIISASDFLSDQSLVEQNAVDGAIYSINITNAGTGYTPTTVVDIVGDGVGATAEAVVNPDGSIEYIRVLNNGAGYTRADVILSDINRIIPDAVDCQSYVILPPIGGHGLNAVKELYGSVACIYTQLKDDIKLIDVGQDFRQYGIMINPTLIGTNIRAVDDNYFTMFKVVFNNTIGLNKDDLLLSDNVYYRVVSVVGDTVELIQFRRLYGTVSINDVFYKPESPEIQYSIISVDTVPTIDKYSGSLIYASFTYPFEPTEEQLISIRTFINF